jgi:hypothetical protein
MAFGALSRVIAMGVAGPAAAGLSFAALAM